MAWRERAEFFVESSEIKGLGGMCIHDRLVCAAPSTTLRVVPLPRFAGEEPEAAADPPPFTGEGDHA
jgi:hypothetical protein